MGLIIRRLVAFILCSGVGRAVCDPAPPTGERPNDQVENEVNMLQSSFRVNQDIAAEISQNKAVPTAFVDLDVAPELRWRNVTAYYKKLGVFPKWFTGSGLPPSSGPVAAILRAMKIDDEYLREMKGIVSDLGLPPQFVENLLLTSVGYELSGPVPPNSTGCSDILAAMPNGTVVHGRNLDFTGHYGTNSGGVVFLPDATLQVLFMRGGKPLFVSLHWPGWTGILTAMRFGGWSFAQNTRYHALAPDIQVGLANGVQGFALSARKIMETTADFETAMKQLYDLNLMAPSFFSVAGPGPYQGAVITIDRGGVHKKGTPLVRRLSSSASSLRHDGQLFTDWNIVQTNDDLNKEPLDQRRPLEEVRLAASVQAQVSPAWVLGEMTGPALDNPTTVYTSVFVPASGFHETIAHPDHNKP
mmetsp:Transcript_10511/g.33227  ORF Transcript_10511/g.33227 Transcript_10511/m.33227 type:complete len:415 (+) Transcript_10511:53-1297(+)